MLLSWPFAWKRHTWEPSIKMTFPFLKAPFIALQEFAKYPWDSTVFFEGRLLRPSEVPPHYLITLLVNCLPEFILAGWLLGLVAVLRIHRTGHVAFDRQTLGAFILFCASVGPLASIIIFHAPLYDNFRHVLFTLPPLIILSATGVWAFARSLANQTVLLGLGVFYAVGILTVIADMRALYPYEYTYFNHLIAGGMLQANQRFEMEYWGTSFREAALWLKEYYRPPRMGEIVYSSNADPELTDYYMRELPPGDVRFRRASKNERANVYLFLRRWRQQSELSWGKTLHSIGREGVSFLDIVEP